MSVDSLCARLRRVEQRAERRRPEQALEVITLAGPEPNEEEAARIAQAQAAGRKALAIVVVPCAGGHTMTVLESEATP